MDYPELKVGVMPIITEDTPPEKRKEIIEWYKVHEPEIYESQFKEVDVYVRNPLQRNRHQD